MNDKRKIPWCVGESVVHHSRPMIWNSKKQLWLCERCGETTRGWIASFKQKGGK